VVIGGGPEITAFNFTGPLQHSDGFQINFESNTIQIDVVALYEFAPFTFNGLIFELVDPDAVPDFGSVKISDGGLPGFDSSRIAFTANSIALNFEHLRFEPPPGGRLSITLEIQAAQATEVPEPASLALWSATAVGLAALARWRRRKEVMQSSAA
jgi:MYXO-CTERM domain-containing protein